ncbi:MAG: hypothetical protein ACJAZP_003366 [Psychromonas sp.]|jgi:hypothetical protein|uniref:hypothetical protein n=1 Tax=Psychromonas sp. TaxID=1884585 RepID=UPI0039E724D7
MATVRFQFQFDAKNSNEKAALIELQGWKALFDDGQIELCLSKQKETLLAGLYLQKTMPGLVEKLAQNLSSAGLDELDYFYKANASASRIDIISEQQKEVLAALQRLQESLDSKMAGVIPPNTAIAAPDAVQDSVVQVEAESFEPAPEATEILSAAKLKLVREIKAKKIF